jgi:hypothetical protein
VAEAVGTSCMSAVNPDEIVSKMVHHGKPFEAVSDQIERLCVPVNSPTLHSMRNRLDCRSLY